MNYMTDNIDTKIQLKHCEELLRLRTRQLFFLMKVSQEIVRAKNIHEQLEIIANGIVDAKLFRRAIITIFGRKWQRIDTGYAGITGKRLEEVKKNKPLPAEIWEKIIKPKYRISQSYYIPYNDPLNEKIGGIPADTSEKEFDGWHPNDYLFVPLRSHTGRIIGMISVDDPYDGKRPTARSDTLLLLEVFARDASELIERNKLMQKLRNQRTYLRRIIKNSADIVVTTDTRGRIRIFNSAAEKLFGYSASEVRGRSVLKLYANPDKARQVMRKMRKSGGIVKDVEIEVLSKSGEKIPISLSASILYDEHHQEIGTVGVSRDLRPAKELERARRLSTISKIAITLSHYTRTHLMAQMSILYNLLSDVEKIEDEKIRKNFQEGLKKIAQRSLMIGRNIETLQNPPDKIEEEKYIAGLEMFALTIDSDIEIEDFGLIEFPPLKILVADDEPTIREGVADFLNSLLFKYGFTVDTARDGREAIRKIKHNDYDLVLTDLKMPYKTGLDVFKAAKERNPETEVIVMTAFHYLAEGSRHWLLRDQVQQLNRENVFICDKPFDFIALAKRIAKMFEK